MPYRLNPQISRLQTRRRIGRGFGAVLSPSVQSALQTASGTYGVPYSLLRAVANRESGYNPSAVGSAGEQGLMQIMPANDANLGLSNPFDPNANAAAGAKLLSQLYGRYGDWGTALIAYNEGSGNLASKGVFPASQAYSDAVLADAGLDGSTAPAGSPDAPGTTAPDSTDSGVLVDSSSGLSGMAWIGIAAAGAGLLLLASR